MQPPYDRMMVTGGAGFIGSHTIDALLDRGLEVWVLDNLSTGSLRNLKHRENNPRLHFKKGDVAKYRSVEPLARKVDAIIHLAAVISNIRNHELTYQVNVIGTSNVLRAALRNQVHKVIFASSAAVYGNSEPALIPESAPFNPITPYGTSKMAAERYCEACRETYGLNVISLRYFNVYGERQRSGDPYSGVVSIFARRLLRGMRPVIYGDGTQTRDFIHISDVVHANLIALQATKGRGGSYNIGTGQATTIMQLYRLLADLTGKRNITPVFREARPADIIASCAMIRKAQRNLNFHPRISLRVGLRALIKSLLSRG